MLSENVLWPMTLEKFPRTNEIELAIFLVRGNKAEDYLIRNVISLPRENNSTPCLLQPHIPGAQQWFISSQTLLSLFLS